MANLLDTMKYASRNAIGRAQPDYDTRDDDFSGAKQGESSIRQQIARKPEPYRDPEEYISPEVQALINDPVKGRALLEQLMNDDDSLSEDDEVPEHGTDEYYDMVDKYIKDQRGPKERT